MTKKDRENELAIAQEIFEKWTAKTNDPSALRGVPLYLAFMHTRGGPKILENNSRPGDPEIINILPVLKDDFVDVCFRMIDGSLTRVEVDKAATVLTYKVPPGYGGYADVFPAKVNKAEIDTPVDLSKAYALSKKHGDRIRVYPAAMEQRNGKAYALKSRAVGVLGIGDSVEEARQVSLEGINAIQGGALWNRTDIASKQHIAKCVRHMEQLRRKRVKRVFISDCEGPISKNDNAFEAAARFVPNGDKLFTLISKYDDVLADVVKKPGYNAGDTLKLILPFLKAYGVTDERLKEFSAENLVLIAGSRETLKHVRSLSDAFVVSTSYEHYIKALCDELGFPFENTYCTRISLDKYVLSSRENSQLRELATEIAQMPMITIPSTAKSLEDFSEQDRETVMQLDSIFWEEDKQNGRWYSFQGSEADRRAPESRSRQRRSAKVVCSVVGCLVRG